MNEIEGTIKEIGEAATYGSSFRKREFILTTNEKFPQDVKFELYQDDCSLIDESNKGMDMKVFFNIKGNEYKGKYYVNLQAWKLQECGQEENVQAENVQEKPKKRGRPKKTSPEPTEDIASTVAELADTPF